MSRPTGDKPVAEVVAAMKTVITNATAEYTRAVQLAGTMQRRSIRDANVVLDRLLDYYKPLAIELANDRTTSTFKMPVNRRGVPLEPDEAEIDHVGIKLTWLAPDESDDDVFVATWADLEAYDAFVKAARAT